MSSCCIKCFDDVSVRVFITNDAYLGCCEYCDSKQIPVLETWRVGKFIRDGLERAYQRLNHPNNYHDDYFIPAYHRYVALGIYIGNLSGGVELPNWLQEKNDLNNAVRPLPYILPR